MVSNSDKEDFQYKILYPDKRSDVVINISGMLRLKNQLITTFSQDDIKAKKKRFSTKFKVKRKQEEGVTSSKLAIQHRWSLKGTFRMVAV